jgi:hypothetical protein
MKRERFRGFIKLSLAHHPLCWHYRPHTIRFKNVAFCLGCTGFYSGIIIGIIFIISSGLHQLNWEELVTMAIFTFLPTLLRLLNFKLFNSKQRGLRFVFRWLLGVGVAIGLFSIFKAPNQIIGLIQIGLGIGLYSIISYRRIRSGNFWQECQDCSFNPSPDCPGFSPFHLPGKTTCDEKVEN